MICYFSKTNVNDQAEYIVRYEPIVSLILDNWQK